MALGVISPNAGRTLNPRPATLTGHIDQQHHFSSVDNRATPRGRSPLEIPTVCREDLCGPVDDDLTDAAKRYRLDAVAAGSGGKRFRCERRQETNEAAASQYAGLNPSIFDSWRSPNLHSALFLFGSRDLAWSELGSVLLSMRLCH